MEKKRIPKRRFREFLEAGEWEEHGLGDILSVSPSRQYIVAAHSTGCHQVIQQGEIPLAGYADGVPFTQYEDTVLFGDHTLSLYKPHAPFFLATDGIKILNANGIVNGEYLYYILEKNMPQSEGYKRYYSILCNQRCSIINDDDEQKKIGNFCRRLDTLISLHQQKLAKLKDLKQAYLTEMFPAPGEKRPRRRFKGFSGDWERIKLGNYVSIKSETSKDLHLPNVEYEDIISGEGRLNKNIYLKNAHKYGKLFKKGDVLYGKLRPYLKNWLLPDFDGIAVGDFWVLHSYTIESQFLYVLIQSEEFMKMANLSIGTKMPRADWNLISQSEFYIPSDTEEQKGIGKFFCEIDLKILHVEEKLQKIILVKQAYLSELFV